MPAPKTFRFKYLAFLPAVIAGGWLLFAKTPRNITPPVHSTSAGPALRKNSSAASTNDTAGSSLKAKTAREAPSSTTSFHSEKPPTARRLTESPHVPPHDSEFIIRQAENLRARQRNSRASAPSTHPIRLPLFYLHDAKTIAAEIPGVTAEGLQVLKNDFEAQAGVGELAPDDPTYAERWHQAELTLEQRMRLWYGWGAWSAFEHQAAVEAAAAQNSTGPAR